MREMRTQDSVKNYMSDKIAGPGRSARRERHSPQQERYSARWDLTSAPQDDEQDYYSKNDHKNYEQAYYIGHPARRQGIIYVPIICFVFISFHVATPLVSVPPLL